MRSLADIEKLLDGIPGYDPVATAGDCTFDHAAADKPLRFFAEHLNFIEGEQGGKKFKLERWQQAVIANLFGWKRPDGLRRYRTCLLFVARKNGKTPLAAGLIDYIGFCDPEPGAQLYSAAGSWDQAALLHRHAAGMIQENSEMRHRAHVYRALKSIEFYGGKTVYRALSADAPGHHGLNAYVIIVDELHVQPNRDLVDTLMTSTGTRREPILMHLTTAGWDRHSVCYEVYDYARKVRDGIIDDPSFLPIIYEVPEADKWDDESVWPKANPNLGVSISLDYLRRECARAKELPAYENTFRRLHLNQWTEQETRWLPMDKWRACGGPLNLADFTGRPCYGGLDLSTTRDLCSFNLTFPQPNGRFATFNWSWCPGANAKKRSDRDRVPYVQWAKDGWITLTEGDVVDYAVIRRDINALGKRFKIQAVGVDPYNATQMIVDLTADGLNMVPFRQGMLSLNEPSKRLEGLIVGELLRHGDNPLLTWAASNVCVETDAAGNFKPSKKRSTERIDPIVTLVMSIGLAITTPVTGPSIYENRGVLIL